MDESAKETVIVVHGTWAALIPAKSQWYQRPEGEPTAEGFVARLDAELESCRSPARCWSHCVAGSQIFHWSGENSWVDRTLAASALAAYVAKLQDEGWRCHIVAHSHGGNVVAEALPQIANRAGRNGSLGRIVTLGTPFMDATTPIAKSVRRLRTIQTAVSWIGWVCVMWAVVGLLAAISTPSFASPVGQLEIGAVISTLAGIAHWTVGRTKRNSASAATKSRQQEPRLLAMSSGMDEAWQILYHLRNIKNPLAVGSSLPRYLGQSAKLQMSRSVQIDRIQGAKSYKDLGVGDRWFLALTHLFCALLLILIIGLLFQGDADDILEAIFLAIMCLLVPVFLILFRSAEFNSAFILPFRRCFLGLYTLGNLFTDVATYIVRRQGWSVVLAMAMGLEGYRYKLPNIEQQPSWLDETLIKYKYEGMPSDAEQRALAMRQAWVNRLLGNVADTFAKLALTTEDIAKLLNVIETDQTFVHAAYYSDEACIVRIANWIAATDLDANRQKQAVLDGLPAQTADGKAEVPPPAKARTTASPRSSAWAIAKSIVGFVIMAAAIFMVAFLLFLSLADYVTRDEFWIF